MMAGTSSSSHQEIEWKDDGSIIYTSSSSFSGKYFESAYKITPENAQKIKDFVEERKIAALTKIDMELPVMYDNFTSSTIVVTYDDRSVGGESHNMYTLQCGPYGMAFKNLESDIKNLFMEIQDSGECIKNDMRDNSSLLTGFAGLGMIDMGGQPGHEQPLQMMGIVPVDTGADKETPDIKKKWTCQCGAENSGKFCCECGQPKPTWTCSCGAENKGKFCMECGQPKPN